MQKFIKKNRKIINFIISVFIGILTIPSLLYYISKYLYNGTLNFKETQQFEFVIVCSLLIFGLIIGIISSYQNVKIYNELLKLKEKINKLKNLIINNHYEDLEFQNNNRDIIVDLGLEFKKDKNKESDYDEQLD